MEFASYNGSFELACYHITNIVCICQNDVFAGVSYKSAAAAAGPDQAAVEAVSDFAGVAAVAGGIAGNASDFPVTSDVAGVEALEQAGRIRITGDASAVGAVAADFAEVGASEYTGFVLGAVINGPVIFRWCLLDCMGRL